MRECEMERYNISNIVQCTLHMVPATTIKCSYLSGRGCSVAGIRTSQIVCMKKERNIVESMIRIARP